MSRIVQRYVEALDGWFEYDLTTGQFTSGNVNGAVQEPKGSGPTVIRDIAAYVSPVCDASGKHPVIEGRRAQREDLRRNNCRIKEPSERLAVAGLPKRPEPVVSDAMIRTAVEAYERAQSR